MKTCATPYEKALKTTLQMCQKYVETYSSNAASRELEEGKQNHYMLETFTIIPSSCFNSSLIKRVDDH